MWYVIVFAVINSIPTLATTDGTYCEVKHTALVTEEDVYNHTANSPSLSAPKQHYYQLKPKHLSCLRLTKISSKECNHLGEAVPKLKTKPKKQKTKPKEARFSKCSHLSTSNVRYLSTCRQDDGWLPAQAIYFSLR